MQSDNGSILISGKIRFPGLHTRLAEYAVVRNEETSFRAIHDLAHNKEKWDLKKPNLIISVTGATRSFHISNQIKKSFLKFKRGLINAAKSTDSWIITHGYNSGVTKLVGEAISEYSVNSEVTCIGIVSLSVVAFNEKLLEPPKNPVKFILILERFLKIK